MFKQEKNKIGTKPFWMGITLFLLLGCNLPPVVPLGPGVVVAPPDSPPVQVPPSGMVLVKGGIFTMGSTDFPDAQPISGVVLDSFYLDQTEVTGEAYQACVTEKKCLPPESGTTRGNNSSRSCNWDDTKMPSQVAAGRKDHPMNCVTFFEAKTYCEAQGKRLPTEMEWEYAAKGSNETLYPWGNAAPTVTDQPQRACWNRIDSSGTCAVASFPATLLGMEQSQLSARGLVGLYDMAGNVFEWVDTQYTSKLSYTNTPCTNPMSECVARGGSWNVGGVAGMTFLRSSVREKYFPPGAKIHFGFRCARNEKP